MVSLDISGKLINDDLAKAEVFNEWFAKQYAVNDYNGSEFTAIVNTFESFRIRDCDILKNLRGIGNHKSSGPDNISGEMLKLGGKAIVPYLRMLFTISLNNGGIPNDWRRANVIPIHKGGSPYKQL